MAKEQDVVTGRGSSRNMVSQSALFMRAQTMLALSAIGALVGMSSSEVAAWWAAVVETANDHAGLLSAFATFLTVVIARLAVKVQRQAKELSRMSLAASEKANAQANELSRMSLAATEKANEQAKENAAMGNLLAEKANELMHDTNKAQVIAHCADRYANLIKSVEKIGNDESKDKQDEIDYFWYQYWDLLCEEFLLFRRDLLDEDLFEFWMVDFARHYDEVPGWYPIDGDAKNVLHMKETSYKKFVKEALPVDNRLREFFDKYWKILEKLATVAVKGEERFFAVRLLVQEFSPRVKPILGRGERVAAAKEGLTARLKEAGLGERLCEKWFPDDGGEDDHLARDFPNDCEG